MVIIIYSIIIYLEIGRASYLLNNLGEDDALELILKPLNRILPLDLVCESHTALPYLPPPHELSSNFVLQRFVNVLERSS